MSHEQSSLKEEAQSQKMYPDRDHALTEIEDIISRSKTSTKDLLHFINHPRLKKIEDVKNVFGKIVIENTSGVVCSCLVTNTSTKLTFILLAILNSKVFPQKSAQYNFGLGKRERAIITAYIKPHMKDTSYMDLNYEHVLTSVLGTNRVGVEITTK